MSNPQPTNKEATKELPPLSGRTIVINNRESLVQGQLPHKQPGQRPDGAAPMLEVGGMIQLLPGVNLVDTKDLKTLRERNPTFAALFDTIIEASPAPEQNPEKVGRPILEIGNEGKELPASSPLARLAPNQCKAILAETFNAALLRTWLAEETRGDVRRDIDAQLGKVLGPTRPSGVSA